MKQIALFLNCLMLLEGQVANTEPAFEVASVKLIFYS